MRFPKVPPLVIPKAPRVPTWDSLSPAQPPFAVSDVIPPPHGSFAEAVILASLHVAERAHAQIMGAPGLAVGAQTCGLDSEVSELY